MAITYFLTRPLTTLKYAHMPEFSLILQWLYFGLQDLQQNMGYFIK
jgi:hypothetical protein